MVSVLQTLVKYLSKPGLMIICLLIYGLITAVLNINFIHFKNHFSEQPATGLKDLLTVNDPDVQTVVRLLNLTNPGFNGSDVIIDVDRLSTEEIIKYNRSLYQREFSSYISSLVPLQRNLPDIRLKDCGTIYSNLTLPKVSIVIIFHNEHWSTVLRTVHSVLDNSPPYLIKEVVLVDDASTEEVLKEPLDNYIAQRFSKVRIIRAKSREGLIRARNLGFEETSAPVVVFLDSHCECFPGWLEPLVTRISEDEKVVATPVLHFINTTTFGLSLWRQGKDLGIPVITFPILFFTWVPIFQREIARRKFETDPVRSPGMVGCVIAVSRVWFKKLGMFDPGLEIYGGENTELSLKTWLCGGSLETLPCSNVAHLYHPHKPTNERELSYNRNIARVASVWLGNYRKFVHDNDSVVRYEDIRDRLAIKHSLQCHPFDFYLNHVYPEIHIRGDGIFTGDIRPMLFPDKCLDKWTSSSIWDVLTIVLALCHGQRGNQEWDFTESREIRVYNFCLDSGRNWEVALRRCHHFQGNQKWSVVEVNSEGHVKLKRYGHCVGIDTVKWRLVMEYCNNSQTQLWIWRKNREPRTSE